MPAEIVVGTPAELARRFLADLAREVQSRAGRRLTLAVPGGSVGDSFFPTLAHAPFEWKDVDILWVDERAVPATSPDSNFGQADRLWLTPAAVPLRRIHRMPADEADLVRAAAAYAERVHALAGNPPMLDWVLLGVGDDGHVASVFPGDPAIAAVKAVTWTEHAPKPPRSRLSLSLDTLARARQVVVAAFDRAKAPVIAAAVQDRSAQTPLGLLLRTAAAPRLFVTRDIADAMRLREQAAKHN
jgi:6-phosphogluconolactonase